MSIEMSEDDNIIYQLETLASYEPSDLDEPEFDVAYEDTNGNEGMLTVCCIDLAGRVLKLICELKAELNLSDEIHHDELIDIQTTVNNTSTRLS